MFYYLTVFLSLGNEKACQTHGCLSRSAILQPKMITHATSSMRSEATKLKLPNTYSEVRQKGRSGNILIVDQVCAVAACGRWKLITSLDALNLIGLNLRHRPVSAPELWSRPASRRAACTLGTKGLLPKQVLGIVLFLPNYDFWSLIMRWNASSDLKWENTSQHSDLLHQNEAKLQL